MLRTASRSFTAGAFFSLALLRLAVADLPVHCLLQDVAGEWDFIVGPPQQPAFTDMVAGIPQCGHHIPNTVTSMISAKPSNEVPAGTAEQFRVRLTEDIRDEPMRHMEVLGLTNASSAAAGGVGGGYWTMVFDEGFEVRAHNGRSFFAHFYFESVPDAKRSPTHGDRWDDIAKYYGRVEGDSVAPPKGDIYACHCDRVSVGWWHQHNEATGKLESGCFWAHKADSKPNAVSMVRLSNENVKSAPHLAPAQLRGAAGSPLKAAPIALHNSASDSGLGRVLEVREIPSDSRQGQAAHKEVILSTASSMDQAAGKPGMPGVVNFASIPIVKNTSLFPGTALPKFWDWRDVVEDMSPPGTDDLSEQFSQGNCGSCYAFSGASVLQMRFRIQLWKKHGVLYPLELSWKSATQCSPYTEGCQGGFAYLTFKFAAEVGLPLAECDHKAAPDSLDGSCNWSCYRNNPNIFYAKNYGQTGGFAHGSGEDSIMEEIHANGPVIVSFAASAIPEFIYNNGKSLKKDTDVMTVIKNDKVPREPSSSNDDVLPWSYTTHSILAVGWGEETGPDGKVLKYWLVRNSWGKDWGNQGYAKIRRGNNDAAIETSAPWVEPDMDRLPPGFLEMATKYHKEHEAIRAKTVQKASTSGSATTENKGGRPAYCKLRPDSPDCK